MNLFLTILILGDSHMMGDFGTELMSKLSNKYNVTSIAIGGGGSRDYTRTLRNICCGYNIREVSKGGKIKTIENNSLVKEIIFKKHKGDLKTIISKLKPDIYIVALGTNQSDDHQKLLNLLPTAPVVWVGPVNIFSYLKIKGRILPLLKTNKTLHFIDSGNILGLGSKTIDSIHYSGASAKRWANIVHQRMMKLMK